MALHSDDSSGPRLGDNLEAPDSLGVLGRVVGRGSTKYIHGCIWQQARAAVTVFLAILVGLLCVAVSALPVLHSAADA